jgi:hypothetical protein
MSAYTWSRAQEVLSQVVGLDPDPFDDTLLEYQNPLTGGPALPTIGTAIQTLRPGANANRIVAQSILAESELLGAILFPTSGQTCTEYVYKCWVPRLMPTTYGLCIKTTKSGLSWRSITRRENSSAS